MIRKIMPLILLAALGCGHAASAFDACRDASSYTPLQKRYTRGLLFRVEKCGEPASYVFGTVHLGRADITRAAGNAFLKLSEVQEAGFEIAMPEREMQEVAHNYMSQPAGDGYELRRAIGGEEYEKLSSLLNESGVSIKTYDRVKPWVIAVVLEFLGDPPGTPLDDKLQYVALSLKKPVFGLESPQDQLDIFASLPDAMQVRLLKEAIDEHNKIMKLKKATINAYLEQDINKIDALEDESIASSTDPELDALLNDKVLKERNLAMVKKLLPKLSGKSVMLSVGAMHLMGPDGILSLLEQQGYFITPEP